MLDNVQSLITLDVYDHDTTPSTIKSIACDDNTRYVMAELTEQGAEYDLPSDASVSLTVLRPDRTGVGITGSPYPYTVTDVDDEGEETERVKYVAYAELDQAAIAIAGKLYAQFKITVGTQILRTEIFVINNGRALDAEITDWSGDYQSYNLDELVERLNNAIEEMSAIQEYVDIKVAASVAERISVTDSTLVINTSAPDVSETVAAIHSYVDTKIANLRTYVDQAVDDTIDVHDNGLYLAT